MIDAIDKPTTATRPRIMIVDDEPIVVKVMALHLRRAGYDNVISTTDSASAVEMMLTCRPDLLLLDLSMPGVGGLDILAAIGADPMLAALRVVIVTATCDDRVKEQARSLGAKAVVSKPIDSVDLIWRVREVLAKA